MSEPRVDLRIPSNLYERIESIAIATNQPFTPKSKNTSNPKPVLTPVIIKLIQLGLSQIDETELESLENDNKELTLKPSANQLNTEEIEKKILNTLLLKLEGIVSDKLESMVATKINLTIEDKDKSKSDNISKDSQIELPLNDKETQSDSISLNTESEFTFVDTVEEIRKLNSHGLNYAQIAKRLTDANYPTKQGKYKWSGTQVKRILEKK